MRHLRLPSRLSVLGIGMVMAVACSPRAAPPAPAPSAGEPASAPVAASPARPIEFVISTEPGGGSDIYARFIQGVIEKNNLSSQPVLPVNKPGGAGAVAFQYTFEKRSDMHFIMITLNSFFTTLIIQKDSLPYTYEDFTPIANLALDPFFLWVNEESAWRTAQDFVAAARAGVLTVAGTGSKQEDEVLFNLIQQKAGTQAFRYVPQPARGRLVEGKALAGGQPGGGHREQPQRGPFLLPGVPAPAASHLYLCQHESTVGPVSGPCYLPVAGPGYRPGLLHHALGYGPPGSQTRAGEVPRRRHEASV